MMMMDDIVESCRTEATQYGPKKDPSVGLVILVVVIIL